MTAWVDFTTELNAEKALQASVFQTFKQRDESAMEAPHQIYIPEVWASGATYPTFSSAVAVRRELVHSGAKKYHLILEAHKAVGAGNGYVKGQLVGSVTAESAVVTVTSAWPSFAVYQLDWADVEALRGQNVELRLLISHASGLQINLRTDAPFVFPGATVSGTYVCAWFGRD